MERLTWSRDELLAEHPYAERLRRDARLYHGGLDASGRYVPPRSLHRPAAIAAWSERLTAAGLPARVIDAEQVVSDFFPTVAQAKLLLRHGARGAMTRILTLVGLTEGFGNDGIRALPRVDLERMLREPIDGTCLAHLWEGLLEAHGNDESGRPPEAGHDVMWYDIRDAALGDPPITPDMFTNLPIAPPPGYTGPATPAPDAVSVRNLMADRLLPTVDVAFEVLLLFLTQTLVIELLAYSTFAWAKEVLGDPACSAAPEFAPQMVERIQQDENIHVAYLQCALAEIRARTVVGDDGRPIDGRDVVARACERVLRGQRGARVERMRRYRMGQVRDELAARSDGEAILAKFGALGPVPDLAAA